MGRAGLKLKQAPTDETLPSDVQWMPEDGRMVPCKSNDKPVFTFYQTSMASLAATISQI